MEQAKEVSQVFIGVLTLIIGWGGVITILLIIRNFVVTALSRALVAWLPDASAATQRMVIKYLTNKNLTIQELYNELKPIFEAEQPQEEKK